MTKRKLKIGLIAQGNILPAWAFVLLQQIRKSDYAELNLIILHQHCKKRKNLIYKLRTLLFSCYHFFEKKAFNPKPDAFKKHPLSDVKDIKLIEINHDIETTHTLKQKKDAILSEAIDVFIALHPTPPKSALTGLSKFGIWSVENTSGHQPPFSVAAIWEVLQQKPVTDLFLTVYDQQPVRFKASYATIRNSIRWNRNFYFWKATCLILSKLEQLNKLGWEKLRITHEISAENASEEMPGNLAVLRGVVKIFWSFLRRKTGNLLYKEQWAILYSFQNNRVNNLKSFHRITPPKDRLWADPFVIKKGENHYIFAEEMFFREQKGKIIATEIDKSGVPGKPVTVLEEHHHLSYPYLFNNDGILYMIPETSHNRSIELYQCDNFPNRWKHVKTILSGLEAADASIFKYNETYWLFANVRMHEGVSINDDLFLFFAKDLYGDEWKPHPMNPVVSDVRFSRPAGQIAIRGNRLIRPAQDCSKRYGYAIHLMEIIELTETDYRERHLETFLPGWETDVLGVHTFNQTDELTVADALIRRNKF